MLNHIARVVCAFRIAVITSSGQASVYTTIAEDESATTTTTPNGDVLHQQQHAPPLQVCSLTKKKHYLQNHANDLFNFEIVYFSCSKFVKVQKIVPDRRTRTVRAMMSRDCAVPAPHPFRSESFNRIKWHKPKRQRPAPKLVHLSTTCSRFILAVLKIQKVSIYISICLVAFNLFSKMEILEKKAL